VKPRLIDPFGSLGYLGHEKRREGEGFANAVKQAGRDADALVVLS
jgi:hypothetical protein